MLELGYYWYSEDDKYFDMVKIFSNQEGKIMVWFVEDYSFPLDEIERHGCFGNFFGPIKMPARLGWKVILRNGDNVLMENEHIIR